MVVQEIRTIRSKHKITLTADEKARQKAQIEKIAQEVATRMLEWANPDDIDMTNIRKVVAREYRKKFVAILREQGYKV